MNSSFRCPIEMRRCSRTVLGRNSMMSHRLCFTPNLSEFTASQSLGSLKRCLSLRHVSYNNGRVSRTAFSIMKETSERTHKVCRSSLSCSFIKPQSFHSHVTDLQEKFLQRPVPSFSEFSLHADFGGTSVGLHHHHPLPPLDLSVT